MRLTIQHEADLRFTAHCRSHEFVADLATQAGGESQGMSPPELFGAALGACIGIHIVKHCRSAGIPCNGLQLHIDWSIEENPQRLGEIFVNIDLANAHLDAEQRQGILEAARHCLLSNTLLHTPALKLHLETPVTPRLMTNPAQGYAKEH